MRVLVVVHGFPPMAQGGSEIYAEAHARTLQRQFGDDVLVLTREHDVTRPEYAVREEQLDALRVVRINNTFKYARTFDDTYRNETIDGLASRAIDDFAPHVAHIHHLTCLSTGIVGQLATRGIPTFVTLHDYWLMCHRGQLLDVHYQRCENAEGSRAQMCTACVDAAVAAPIGLAGARLLRTMKRHAPGPAALLRRSGMRLARVLSGESDGPAERRTSHMQDVCADVTHFIAPCRFMKDRFVAFGIEPDRITVADYGFDREPFAAARRVSARGPLRVGFLGSLMISKGPHLLLEAISRLPHDAVSVSVYGAHTAYHGDDSYRDRLRPLLAQPNVAVHGPLSHADVPDALASLDVLVVPSIWPENSPLVIHEAFLAGVPVIASNIGGIPELVTHEVNGLLFRAGDADDLARALTRVAGNPDLLNTLREGIPAVRSIETDVRELRAIYQRARAGR
jgi:glycosyltransferase involved in cell wall biosynthesis